MTTQAADAQLLASLRDLRAGTPEPVAAVGRQVFETLVDRYRVLGEHPRHIVDALSALMASPDPEARSAGLTVLFTCLVERLGDAFQPDLADLYDAVFSQIIDTERRRPDGRDLDGALDAFGLGSEDALRKRRLMLRRSPPIGVETSRIRSVVLFSRVTVGADVAITSVIVGAVKRACPDARILLVAPARSSELFAGDPQIEILEAAYPRRGSIADRLTAWVTMLDSLGGVPDSDDPGVLFIDPDSRLTQLGLLPVTRTERAYRIFDSRSYGAGGGDSLGRLAAQWAGEIFGRDFGSLYPYVQPGEAQLELGRNSIRLLRGEGRSRIVALNFGVGGNPQKRVSEEFETRLILDLFRAGYRIVLDKGIGTEATSVNRILGACVDQGARVFELHQDNVMRDPAKTGEDTDILAWNGGLGIFTALIAASDVYVGYDSAFQHIAAALGIPLVALLPGRVAATFRKRWRPYARSRVQVLGERVAGNTPDTDSLVRETLAAIGQSCLPGVASGSPREDI